MVAAVHDLKCEGLRSAIDYHGCLVGKKQSRTVERSQTVVGLGGFVVCINAVFCWLALLGFSQRCA